MLSNVLDHSCELRGVLMVEKFWQRHGPVEPRVEDLRVLRIIHGDQVVHCGDVAACLNCDRVSRFDGDGRQHICFRANLVGGDGPDGLDEPCVVSQAVDFLPGAVNPEFAVAFNEGGTAQIEGAKAVADDVCLQN